MPGSEQQDLRRQGAVVAYPPLRQPCDSAAQAGSRDRRSNHTALGAFYRRLSARTGKAKAVTATARKIAVLFYNAVRHGMDYVDPSASSYETRYRARVIQNLHRRAKTFGFVLQPTTPLSELAVS